MGPLEATAAIYLSERDTQARTRGIGLTKLYNEFHDQQVKSASIVRLRELHLTMDREVAEAYGWPAALIEHRFEETRAGDRFMLSAPSRAAVLERLLEENHRRYADEVRQGLHKKGGNARRAADGDESPEFELR